MSRERASENPSGQPWGSAENPVRAHLRSRSSVHGPELPWPLVTSACCAGQSREGFFASTFASTGRLPPGKSKQPWRGPAGKDLGWEALERLPNGWCNSGCLVPAQTDLLRKSDDTADGSGLHKPNKGNTGDKRGFSGRRQQQRGPQGCSPKGVNPLNRPGVQKLADSPAIGRVAIGAGAGTT